VYGDVELSNGDVFCSQWYWRLRFMNTVHHQGLFIKKKIFDNYKFNITYKIYADFDINQKLYKMNVSRLKVPYCISLFNVDGISQDVSIKERKVIVHENYGIIAMYITYLWYKYSLLKRKISGV